MRPTRLALAAPTLLLLASGLVACGGGDSSGAPEDASQADFCDAIVNSPDELGSDDAGEAVEAAHEYADRLREIGTPDVGADAREGFELYVDLLADVEEEDVAELADSDPSDVFDGEDLDKFEAFSDVTADCGPGEVDEE